MSGPDPTLTIFLVSDCIDYEGCGAIATFKHRADAEDFVIVCEEYDKKRPECPDGDDDSEWDEYSVKHKEWISNHPGGEDCTSADNYVVSEIPYYEWHIKG